MSPLWIWENVCFWWLCDPLVPIHQQWICDIKSIPFLDINIYEDGNLCSSLYCKPTAGNNILHTTSFHPKSLIKSIPHSQYLHIKHNYSDEDTFKTEADQLRARLLLRGYSRTCLKKAYNHTLTKSRQQWIHYKKTATPQNSIITKFSNQHSQLRKIIQKHWHLLTIDPTVRNFVPSAPAVTFRRAKSLWDHFVHSEYSQEGQRDPRIYPGTFTCGGCGYCKYICTTHSPTLPNGTKFKPKHYANCKTKGLVYMLMCDCNCFYIGKTI